MNPGVLLIYELLHPVVLLLALTALFAVGSIGLVVFVFLASRTDEDELLASEDSW
ncbi:hypothetical protein [Natrarchaeobaculum aegyptiacum]|uniref:hypothetical protein n=1 Tax=Natrarchaeobaculum aegyptiacum TaxID=745377 RepID=UPI0013747606|nr:hypothetical protein [Natrarchaeobaculum aegyptiacum]